MYTHTNRQHNYFTLLNTCMATTILYQTEYQLYRTNLALVHVVATITGNKFTIAILLHQRHQLSHVPSSVIFFVKPFADRYSPVSRRD